MSAGPIWQKYIEFELLNNHMGFMNLLCYLSIRTPLIDNESLLEQYMQNLDSLFDNIVDDMKSESFTVPQKYQSKQDEVENLLFKECGGDKIDFMNRIKMVAQDSQAKVAERLQFE